VTENNVIALGDTAQFAMGGDLAVIPPQSLAVRLNDHVAALRAANEIAGMIHKTVKAYDGGVDEKGKRRPGRDEATVAIYHGQLIGLDPIQALQNIIVIHGMPSMYARTMKAMLLRDGHKVETVISNAKVATVRAKHRNSTEWEEATWTIERARQAGYDSNPKYRSDPEGMLYARALSDACKRAAPDALLGMATSYEELENEAAKPVRVESERVSATEVLADNASAEPAGESPAEQAEAMATRPQQNTLAKLLEAAGIDDRAQKLAYLSEQFKRSITAANQITAAEADELIAYLQQPVADEPGTVDTDETAGGAE
jgi:hypothetical protein